LVFWFLPEDSNLIHLILLAASVLIGTWSAHEYALHTGIKDPSEVVIDEVAGMWISLLFIPKNIFLFTLAFVLFRLFDIFKPWVINKVQDMKGGFGIMLDDILAGIFTRIIIGIALLV